MNKELNSIDILNKLNQLIKSNLVEKEESRDYKKEYEDLINKARKEELFGRDKIPFEYKYETHHIMPKCMGGSDEPSNLINLTLGEHFDAHYLLFKMYNHERLNYAFKIMYGDKTQTYEEARQAFIERRPLEY